MSRLLRDAAMYACLAMAALLVLLQFVLTPARQAPFVLFFLFTALWLFGAAMLWFYPVFGATGTVAWGLISAAGAAQTHKALGVEDLLLIGGSLVPCILAAAYLASRRRRLA